ncbi:MAG: septum formation initiator family protein [Bacteroidia bacterium]|nr:septum formation initiator family protein [Bacteroidia bacterium]
MRQWILNKYLICFLIFLVWMTFFDRNNFIYQHENRTQLQVMEQERQYYEDQIKENEKELQELLTNKETLEKFAREKYLMKKDNEEIFVILKEEKVINKSWWEKFKDRVVSIFG